MLRVHDLIMHNASLHHCNALSAQSSPRHSTERPAIQVAPTKQPTGKRRAETRKRIYLKHCFLLTYVEPYLFITQRLPDAFFHWQQTMTHNARVLPIQACQRSIITSSIQIDCQCALCTFLQRLSDGDQTRRRTPAQKLFHLVSEPHQD